MKSPRLSLFSLALVAVALVGVAQGNVVQTDISALTFSGNVLVGIDTGTTTSNIIRSTDGGATFTTAHAATLKLFNINAYGSTVIAVGDQGIISRSTDAGLNWVDLPTISAPAVGPLKDVGSSNGTFWVTVGQTNGLAAAAEWSNDGGANWSAATAVPSVTGALRSVVYDSGTGRWCAVGSTLSSGAIILTSADGKTWTTVTPPSGATALNKVASNGAGHLLVVGEAGCLLSSADGGQTFALEAGSGSVSEDLTALVYSSTTGVFTAGGQDLVQINYTAAGGSAVSQAPVPGGGDITTLVVDSSGQVLLSGGGFSTVAAVTLGNLSATYDGIAKQATATTVPTGLNVVLAYDGSGTPPINAGSYTVTGTISDATYTGVATGMLVIAKADQTISFTGPADQVLSSTPITLSASSSASLTVSFTLVSGPATLSGNSLTLTGEGTVVLQATQAGDSNRNAATPVNQSFVVTGLSFEAWQAVNFTSGELADTNISGANAIYGQDGLTNLLKYALGLDPKVNASAVTQITTNATDWVFTYQRPSAIADVSYEVEFSIDLSSWSTAGVTHSLLSSSGGVDTWTASYPLSSATRVFFRLVVTH